MVFPAVILAALAGQPSPFSLQVFLVAVLGILSGAWMARKTLGVPLSALCAYLCIGTAARVTVLLREEDLAPALLGLRHTVLLLACVALAVVARRYPLRSPEKPVVWLLFSSAVLTQYGFPPIQNTSISGGVLASLLPFTGPLFGAMFVILASIALTNGSSTALAGLFVVGVARVRWFLAFLPLVALKYLFRPPRLDQSERWEMWRLSIESIWTRRAWVFGTGYGTFHYHGPAIRRAAGLPTVWYTMHSDVLQILFETGAVGLLLFAWVTVDAVRRQNGNERAASAALLVCALWNFPLEIPAVLVYAAWLAMPASRPEAGAVPSPK